MSRTESYFKSLVACLLAGLLFIPAGCETEQPQPRIVGSDNIVLAWPDSFDPRQRPPVEFPHAKHAGQPNQLGCNECHLTDANGGLNPRLKYPLDISDSDAYTSDYHDLCIGCHQERLDEGKITGPVDCGQCHSHKSPPVTRWTEMHLDYSLHYRHIKSMGNNCESCHHCYDEDQKRLYYKKGEENSCEDCHQDTDQGNTLSWKNAAHTQCVGCHLQRKEHEQKAGPSECAGCHDQQERAKIEKLEKVPRLDRKQPDRVWICNESASSGSVPFNHEVHEHLTSSCSTCHHHTMKSCDECHTPAGDPSGGGITLYQAYHMPNSALSCVGCHQKETSKAGCAGCHKQMEAPPGEHSCTICHSGPPADKVSGEPPAELFNQVRLNDLPKASENAFPENIVLDIAGEEYKPARFPHLKMVEKLDRLARDSKLAARFHGSTNTLCSGCHHHMLPNQVQPSSCRSCHGNKPNPLLDIPDIKAAYHRQCLDCHQSMGIKKAMGCTDCHEKADKEAAR